MEPRFPLKLDYAFICGLVEGEGSFYYKRNGQYKIPAFAIHMHYRDWFLLERVRITLKLERIKIYKFVCNGYPTSQLLVRNRWDLFEKIVPFFYNRLQGYKAFQFREWLEKMNSPEVSSKYRFIYRYYRAGYFEDLYKQGKYFAQRSDIDLADKYLNSRQIFRDLIKKYFPD